MGAHRDRVDERVDAGTLGVATDELGARLGSTGPVHRTSIGNGPFRLP
jgi:hypothetical protein